jgi:hypothetical protein
MEILTFGVPWDGAPRVAAELRLASGLELRCGGVLWLLPSGQVLRENRKIYRPRRGGQTTCFFPSMVTTLLPFCRPSAPDR